MTVSLRKRTISGVAWTGSATFLLAGMNFLINAVLAHLLLPVDFGLMGVVLVVTGFAMMLGDLGFAASVIQKKDISDKQLTTLFYFNLLIGVLLTVGCYMLSEPLAWAFGYPQLSELLKAISFSFIVVSFGQVMRSLMQKQIRFKTLCAIDITGGLIYGVCSITLALQGMGVWSLVYGLLAKQLSDSILLWINSSFKPCHGLDGSGLKDWLNFGVYVYAEKFLNYFNGNLDNILIGKFIGLEALGYYTLAYNLMLFPVFKIGGVVSQVAFPVFSMVQSDDAKIREGYLKMIRYISIITFPIMGILFVLAPEFITLVFGPKWQPSIQILQIFCVVGAVRSIATTIGSVLYAKGRSDMAFKMNFFIVIYHAIGFVIGLRWGIVGVATAYAIITLTSLPIDPYLLKKIIGLDTKNYIRAIWPQIAGTFATIAVLSILHMSVGGSVAAFAALLLLGIAVYLSFMYVSDRRLLLDGLALAGVRRHD